MQVQVGDLFKIDLPGKREVEVVYQAVVVTDSGWVSAKVVHPVILAEKLKNEGVFKIDLNTLDITIMGNVLDDGVAEAIYG